MASAPKELDEVAALRAQLREQEEALAAVLQGAAATPQPRRTTVVQDDGDAAYAAALAQEEILGALSRRPASSGPASQVIVDPVWGAYTPLRPGRSFHPVEVLALSVAPCLVPPYVSPAKKIVYMQVRWWRHPPLPRASHHASTDPPRLPPPPQRRGLVERGPDRAAHRDGVRARLRAHETQQHAGPVPGHVGQLPGEKQRQDCVAVAGVVRAAW